MSVETSPQSYLTQIITTHRTGQCLAVIIRLGILDSINESPKNAKSLASSAGLNTGRLERVLRFLVSKNMLVEEEQKFSLNENSRLLCDKSSATFRLWLLNEMQSCHWQSWLGLEDALRSDTESCFEAVHGEPFFEYLAANSESSELFHGLMASMTADTTFNPLQDVDLSDAKMVIDIGGGQGVLLAEVLATHSHLQGTLYERSSSGEEDEKQVQQLKPWIQEKRAEIIHGDFFQEVPSGGDVYILKQILHDWEDEKAIQILKNCRQSMAHNSRLLVIERLLDEKKRDADLLMMLLLAGKERSREQFAELFNAAGLKLSNVRQVNKALFILEALPQDLG